MAWHILAWRWLAHAAVGGLIILALGSLAARLCRQPVRRARLVVLTMLGALLVPWLGAVRVPFSLPIATRWSSGILPSLATVLPRGTASAPIAARRETSPGALPRPSGTAGLPDQAVIPVRAGSGAGRGRTQALSTFAALPWRPLVLIAYASTSAGLLAWWILGHAVLWRVSRAARLASPAVRQQLLLLGGPAAERVRLLVSDRIRLPFTYTWTRPVILLPSTFASDDVELLRYGLAHEWSHVERRDARAWNLTAIAGMVLFYQPLFWWLRRQLRLCQDYLADDRAASAGSPEDYAAYLVRLARDPGRASRAGLPALGVLDHPSNLSRRVAMLINDRAPLEHRCPMSWSLGTAAATVLAILVAAGLRAGATPAAETPKPAIQDPPPSGAQPASKGEALRYSGTVREQGAGQPIAGATVTVRRKVSDVSHGDRIIAETRHTTNAQGVYSFTVPPEQVAEKRLYIELDVEHPDYAPRGGFGYSLALIRQDEANGLRPFFQKIALRPAKLVLGRVETPDGRPAQGVEVRAYSLSGKVHEGPLEHGSLATVKTDNDGRFRIPVTTPGLGVFWILPKRFAPETHAIGEDQRGEIGTFRLKPGMTVKGRAFDTQGKPLAGMIVTIGRDPENSPDRRILEPLAVSDAIERRSETDTEGRFTFDPLPAGVYVVQPVEYQDVVGPVRIHRPVPGVFAPYKVTIREGETPGPIEIHAASPVVIEGRWLDSKGRPRSGSQLLIIGHIDDQTWHTWVHPSAEGRFSVQVPGGMNSVQITLFPGQFDQTRYRMSKGGKLEAGQFIMFGKQELDHDVKDLEIIRYDETGVIVQANAKDGRPVKDLILAGEYTEEIASARAGIGLKNGVQTEILFERQGDGRFRATDLTPDRELKITAYAEGFQPASRKVKLPEGKTEELIFVLEPR